MESWCCRTWGRGVGVDNYAINMKTISDQQIQIINSNRSAKTTDRYLDSKGNVWVGGVNGRLFLPPYSTELPSSKTDGSLSVEQRLLNLEASVAPIKDIKFKQVQIDFGATLYQQDRIFNVPDSDITEISIIQAQIAYLQPSGKDLDELTMDDIVIKAGVSNGIATLYVSSITGSLYGKFWIAYSISR